MAQRDESPRIFVPPPLIILGTLLTGLWADGRLAFRSPFMLIPLAMGALVVCVGLGTIAAALGVFRKAETRPEPWKPAANLVLKGVYRFTRNPMYLGMLLTYAGFALAFRSVTAAALLLPLFVVIDRVVVAREEAYLTRRFGADYIKYKMEVRRWL